MNYIMASMLAVMLACFGGLPVSADVAAALGTEEIRVGLGANDLTDMAWDGASFWVEGSGTLTHLVGDGFHVTDWITLERMDGFGRGSITALWAHADTVIASWGYTDYYELVGGPAPYGDGISISIDNGVSWRHVTVLDMFPDRSNLGAPNRYTTIYDLTLEQGRLWCCTTSGYLLKSTDMGETWLNILPTIPGFDDETTFDFQNTNHHGQCMTAYGDTLWVGTFKGLNLSEDGGMTWRNFSWAGADTAGADPTAEHPGDFPVAVTRHVLDGVTQIWSATQPYADVLAGKVYGKTGVCMTADNGETWQYRLELDALSRPWAIAFGHDGASDPAVSDSTVFVATSAGLMVSYDLGGSWNTLEIRESAGSFWEPGSQVASVMTVGDTLWATSADGLARSTNWGATWAIFKGVSRVKALDTGDTTIGIAAENDPDVTTYAFPNPFSPTRSDVDYGRTRIQYAIGHDALVTIRLYDYSGRQIRDLLTGEFRTGGRDYQEMWDGRDESNARVPNGVYFYIISTDKGDSAIGKIMVLD